MHTVRASNENRNWANAKEDKNEMKREIALAAAKLIDEQGRYSKLEEELREVKAQSLNKEKMLDGDLQLLRTNSFKLKKVSFLALIFLAVFTTCDYLSLKSHLLLFSTLGVSIQAYHKH